MGEPMSNVRLAWLIEQGIVDFNCELLEACSEIERLRKLLESDDIVIDRALAWREKAVRKMEEKKDE